MYGLEAAQGIRFSSRVSWPRAPFTRIAAVRSSYPQEGHLLDRVLEDKCAVGGGHAQSRRKVDLHLPRTVLGVGGDDVDAGSPQTVEQAEDEGRIELVARCPEDLNSFEYRLPRGGMSQIELILEAGSKGIAFLRQTVEHAPEEVARPRFGRRAVVPGRLGEDAGSPR